MLDNPLPLMKTLTLILPSIIKFLMGQVAQHAILGSEGREIKLPYKGGAFLFCEDKLLDRSYNHVSDWLAKFRENISPICWYQ